METMAANELLRGDILLLEVSIARYYDITGKAPNWTSSRVYFHLESISLLRRGDATDDKQKSGPSNRTGRMDEAM